MTTKINENCSIYNIYQCLPGQLYRSSRNLKTDVIKVMRLTLNHLSKAIKDMSRIELTTAVLMLFLTETFVSLNLRLDLK
jgi:hypothetical protein